MDWQLDVDDLPLDFSYPPQFVRLVELGLMNPEPWYLLTGEQLLTIRHLLVQAYPARDYVPFASDQRNDDFACWERGDGRWTVVVVHMRTERERRSTFTDTYAWFRTAVQDMIDFGE